MEAFFLKAIADGLITAGFPALLLAVAVWWFQRNQVILVAKLDTQSQVRIDEMKSMYEARLAFLEVKSVACEKDRDEMRARIWSYFDSLAVNEKNSIHFNPQAHKPVTY